MALGLGAFCRYAFIRKCEQESMLHTILIKKAKKTIPDE